MYVLLNGSFGVGKSHVARELRRSLPDSAIADPEWIGVLLQRLARRHRSDFQHDPLWRRLAVTWARLRGIFCKTVIVPMAFTELGYLNEIRSSLAATGRPVLHFCLVAPLDVVRDRLARRGEPVDDARWAWVHRRAAECCAAHERPEFSTHVPTVGKAPAAVADLVMAQLPGPNGRAHKERAF